MGMGLGPFQSEQTEKEVVPDQAVKKLPQVGGVIVSKEVGCSEQVS